MTQRRATFADLEAMSPLRPLRLALSGAVLSLAAAAPAAAAPFSLSASADFPRAALGADGTLHAVLNEQTSPTSTTTAYCRVPAGASACAPGSRRELETTGRDLFGGSFVFVDGATVRVVLHREAATNRIFTSTDGGANFDAGVAVSTRRGCEAALLPAGSLTTLPCGTTPVQAQSGPLAGPPTPSGTFAELTDQLNPAFTDGALAPTPDGGLVAVLASSDQVV